MQNFAEFMAWQFIAVYMMHGIHDLVVEQSTKKTGKIVFDRVVACTPEIRYHLVCSRLSSMHRACYQFIYL